MLWGAVFLSINICSFLAVFFSAAARPKGKRLSLCFDRQEFAVGDSVVISLQNAKRRRFPAVLIRYEIPLRTVDGRTLPIIFDPETTVETTAEVKRRGAYYAANDILSIRDAFGFFFIKWNIPVEDGPRLFALPEAKPILLQNEPKAGGDARRDEPHFAKTDELTESRRYLPGDDPRRINWKLYSHSGELFVRDGEPEPPPRSRYAVIVDSSVDRGIFSAERGADAVDTLAETALGLVTALSESGFSVEFGASGLTLVSGDQKAAALFFARLSEYSIESAPSLPSCEDPKVRVIVLALPRRIDRVGTTSLDALLQKRSSFSASVELLFEASSKSNEKKAPLPFWRRALFRIPEEAGKSGDSIEQSNVLVEACVAAYSGKGGVRARRLEV